MGEAGLLYAWLIRSRLKRGLTEERQDYWLRKTAAK